MERTITDGFLFTGTNVVIVTGAGSDDLHDFGNHSGNLCCRKVVNYYQPTGEVTAPVLDSPIGMLDHPGVRMSPELARSFRDS